MRASYVATALCVLCVFGSAMASQQKLFAELMHAAKAGTASRPAKLNENYGVDYKHLCMREARHYNCRTIGCQQVLGCNTIDTPDCYNCVTGIVFQSDMSCCGENHDHDHGNYADYYGAANAVSSGGTGFDSPFLRIGTCDWDITLDKEDICWVTRDAPHCPTDGLRRRRQAGFEMGQTYARRVGSAFATCYLTSGAEFCDDMLCDKMVLRFQGGFYLSGAQSNYQKALPQTAAEVNEGLPNNAWCGPSLYRAYEPSTSTSTTKPFTGVALLASGTVSLASMRKDVEYPVGHMDYVYDFIEWPVTGTDTIDSITDTFGLPDGEYPFLTPNTYKLKLVGEKKATYKK